MITATRYHDICCGHRVYGHESKCAHLHGHNYRITFVCQATELDELGRVMDFSVIKSHLCEWLEEELDHRFLVWEEDPLKDMLVSMDDKVVVVPFNPTAENIGQYLGEVICPKLLDGTGVKVIECSVEETRKCSAQWRA